MMVEPETLQSAVAEAEALRRQGDYDGAKRRLIAALRASRADREGHTALAGEVFLIEHIASLAVIGGDPELADFLLDAAQGEHEAHGESWRSDFAALQRIHIALTSGRIDDARERFREAGGIGSVSSIPREDAELQRWEESRPWPEGEWRARLFTSTYLELARLCIASGAFEQAVRHAARGLRHANGERARGMVRDAHIPLRLAMAEARLSQGHVSEARERLASAGPVDAARYPAWHTEWLALSARSAWLAGSLGAALEHAKTLLHFCASLRLPHAIAHAKLNLAELRMQLNQHAEAQRLLADVAISDATYLRPEIAARLGSLETLCSEERTIYFDGPRSVLEQHQRRAIRTGLAPPPLTAAPKREWDVSHASRVDELLLHARASFGGATDELHELVEASDSPLFRARAALTVGLSAYGAGLFEACETQLAAARDVFLRLGVLTELYECQRWLAWTWRRLGRQESSWRTLRGENGALLDRIASTLGIQDRAAFFLNKWSEEEEDLAEELKEIDARQTAIRGFAPAARLRLVMRRSRFLDRLFAVRDAFARTVVAGEPGAAANDAVSATPLWRRLLVPPRSATVLFLVLPNGVAAFCVQLGRIACVITPTSRERVRELVAECHRRWDGPRAAVLARAIGLADALQQLPRWIRRLTIVADDVLHGVPFAALPFEDRPLVHRFAITMAHGAASRAATARARAESAALFVDVSRGMPGQALLDNEPQSRVIRDAVAASALRKLDGTSCRPSVLVDALQQVDVAHITCHGVFDPANPHQTGLVLSDGNGGAALLTLRDLSRARFQRLRLAVLVSCWSADAYVRPGRWVVSAPETLCRAGAESVIAALWEVDNVRVAGFLEALYRNLRTMRRDEALRQAQLEVEDTLLPYVWAAFQLHGDGRHLRWKGFR